MNGRLTLTAWRRRFVLGVLLALAAGLASGAAPVIGQEPVPPNAQGPQIPAKGYLVTPFGKGLYGVTEGAYQSLFYVTRRGVIVVDAPPSLGKNLLRAIREVTSKPVTHVVYSHFHRDHIGAAPMFPKKAVIIAHAATAAELRAARDPSRPVPERTFRRRYHLRVGGAVLELAYRGTNHEPGNIFVWAPKQRVLMLVDVVFPGWVPFANLGLTDDVDGFERAHRQILAYPFTRFVGGHLTRYGTRQDIERAREYFLDVKRNATRALREVDFNEIARQLATDDLWVVYRSYLDAVARRCAELTEPNWLGRLGGVGALTYSHCWTTQNALRIG